MTAYMSGLLMYYALLHILLDYLFLHLLSNGSSGFHTSTRLSFNLRPARDFLFSPLALRVHLVPVLLHLPDEGTLLSDPMAISVEDQWDGYADGFQ